MALVPYLILLSLVVYRVSRFFILDTLIEETRGKVEAYLEARKGKLLFRKLHTLMGCPFCVTIWVSAATVLVSLIFIDVPLPVFTWLAGSAGALIIYKYIDFKEKK